MGQVVKKLPSARSPTTRASLLFVDDEPRVLSSMRALFRREYDVTTATGGAEALEVLKRVHIDVIISDQRMPEMTGVELLTLVKELAPDTVRILLTGYADLGAIEASINEGEVFRYLVKPCPPAELKETIGLAVESARDRQERESPKPSNVVLMPLPENQRPARKSTQDRQTKPAQAAPKKAAHATPGKAAQASAKRKVVPRTLAEIAASAEILVLSGDEQLLLGVGEAVAGSRVIHVARYVRDAVAMLEEFDIGIMITDIAHDEDTIRDLNETLQPAAPELVTLVASERSDGPTLIDLINQGHVFRFLLKPLHSAQCRIWIKSASLRYAERIWQRAKSNKQATRAGASRPARRSSTRKPSSLFNLPLGQVVTSLRAFVRRTFRRDTDS